MREKVLQYYLFNRNRVHTYLCVSLGIIILGIAYLTSGPTDAEANAAKKLFAEWKESPSDTTLQKNMERAVHKIPGLEKGVEAQKAQVLLSTGRIEAAESMARECIERLRKESPTHAAFAENSLLIENEQFQKALENAVALKEQLEKASEASSAIYASNLVRIAFLQDKVGNAPGELSAWEEVKTLLETEESSKGAQFLTENFQEQAFSLNNYISQRERILILAH
jgi:hypothetical protein